MLRYIQLNIHVQIFVNWPLKNGMDVNIYTLKHTCKYILNNNCSLALNGWAARLSNPGFKTMTSVLYIYIFTVHVKLSGTVTADLNLLQFISFSHNLLPKAFQEMTDHFFMSYMHVHKNNNSLNIFIRERMSDADRYRYFTKDSPLPTIS